MSRAYLYRGETATLRVVALSQGRPMPITDDIEIELEVRTTSMGRVLVKNTAGDFDMSAAADGIILCPLSADDTRQLTPGRATINITIRRDGGVSMGATSDIDILRPSSMPSPNNNRLIPMDVVISDAPVEIVLDFIGSEPTLKTINGESLKGEGNINTHLHYATTVDDLPSDVPDGDEGIVSINEGIITEDIVSCLQKWGEEEEEDEIYWNSYNIAAIKFSWLDDKFPDYFGFHIYAIADNSVVQLSVDIDGSYVDAFYEIDSFGRFDWNKSTTDPSKAAEEIQSTIDAIIAWAASKQALISVDINVYGGLDNYLATEITYSRPAEVSKYVRVSGGWQQQPQFSESGEDYISPSGFTKRTIFMRNLSGGYRDCLVNVGGLMYPMVIGNNGYNVNDLYVYLEDDRLSNYYVLNWQYLLDQGSIPPQILNVALDWIKGGMIQLRLDSWCREPNGSLWADYSVSPMATDYQIFSYCNISIFIDVNANPQAQIPYLAMGQELVCIGSDYNPRKLPELDDATYVRFSGETTIDNAADLKNLFKTLVKADMMLPLSLEVEIPGAKMGAFFTVRLDNLAKEPGSNRIWARYSATQVYNTFGESCTRISVDVSWRSVSSIVIGGQYYGFTKNI